MVNHFPLGYLTQTSRATIPKGFKLPPALRLAFNRSPENGNKTVFAVRRKA